MRASKITTFFFLSFLSASCVPGMSMKERSAFAKRHPQALTQAITELGPLEYVRMGSGRMATLVFVHGSPGGWHAFAHLLERKPLQKSYTMISVDRPGYGGSGVGKTERSLAKQAARIATVLEALDLPQPIVLIGHSFGGPVIARMAIDQPDTYSGLVLIAASLDPALEKTKWFQYPANWSIFRWMLPNALDVCNQEILALKSELLEIDSKWQAVKVPTAIVHGEKDRLVPYENTVFVQHHFTGATLKLFVDAELNHFVPWKRPDLILDATSWVLESSSTAFKTPDSE